MEAMQETVCRFFERIDRDLERSRELRSNLQGLLNDVRRANQRQSRANDDLQERTL